MIFDVLNFSFTALDKSLTEIINYSRNLFLFFFRARAVKILSKNFARLTVIMLLLCLTSSDVFAGCGDNANPALKTMCDLMRLLQGRIGRTFITVTIVISAFQIVINGKTDIWTIITLVMGVGLFSAPKTIALFILPGHITGVMGEGYTPNQILTPDEILACACPDLR